LQKKLDDTKGKWVDELHGVLWPIRTTKKSAVTYGSEVVLLIDIAFHTHHLSTFQVALKNAALWEALDLLPFVRGDALLKEALYKLRIVTPRPYGKIPSHQYRQPGHLKN